MSERQGNHHLISGHVIFGTNKNRREDGVFWQVYTVYRCSHFFCLLWLVSFSYFFKLTWNFLLHLFHHFVSPELKQQYHGLTDEETVKSN